MSDSRRRFAQLKTCTLVIGSNPMDWKKSSAASNICMTVQPLSFRVWVRSMLLLSGNGASSTPRALQTKPSICPRRWTGIGPSGSMSTSGKLRENRFGKIEQSSYNVISFRPTYIAGNFDLTYAWSCSYRGLSPCHVSAISSMKVSDS